VSRFEDLKKAANLLAGREGFELLRLLSTIEANGNAPKLIDYMDNLASFETTEPGASP
jgi:hypothetical protein